MKATKKLQGSKRKKRILIFILFFLFCTTLLTIVVSFTPLSPTLSHPRDDLSYAVVIDAGSSGSRVYLYEWPPHSGSGSDLLSIDQMTDAMGTALYMKIEPGLSSCAEDPSSAFRYIQPLLNYAASHIPGEAHKSTSLFILATAGLRLIPPHASRDILQTLRVHIPLHYDFLLSEDNVRVISGRDEGVFSWIALNYLLGELTSGRGSVGTVGSLDLGGGSMQIAFEVSDKVPQVFGDKIVDIDLSCGMNSDYVFKLFVTTYLGFGANEARRRYLASKSPWATTDASTVASKLLDPCSPVDMHEDLEDKGKRLTIHGTGNFKDCRSSLLSVLTAPSNCSEKEKFSACTTDIFVKPPIDYNMQFYGFSEFWYTMQDVFLMGGGYSKEKFEEAAAEFCSNRWSKLQHWYAVKLFPLASEDRFKTQCFKAAWMSVVLHEGFGFANDTRMFTSAEFIKGRSLQWALGAAIYHTRCLPIRTISPIVGTSSSSASRFVYFTETSFHLLMLLFFLMALLSVYLFHRRVHTASGPSLLRTVSFASLSKGMSRRLSLPI